MEKKDFNELYDELQYFSVENPMEKTADKVASEIAKFIEERGWPCVDDEYMERFWFFDNEPDFPEDKIEEGAVCELDFLCANEYCVEHDADWVTFNIVFIGEWGKTGFFSVRH